MTAPPIPPGVYDSRTSMRREAWGHVGEGKPTELAWFIAAEAIAQRATPKAPAWGHFPDIPKGQP